MSAEQLVANLEAFVINPIIWLLFGVALVIFLWGVVEFLAGFESEEKQTQGKRHMLWGIIGLAIMVSAIGIKEIVENTICDGECAPPSEQLDLN